MAAITICSDFRAPKIKPATVSTVYPSICHEVMGPDAIILVFWMLSFKPTFPLSSFTKQVSIWWLQSPSTAILKPKKIKSITEGADIHLKYLGLSQDSIKVVCISVCVCVCVSVCIHIHNQVKSMHIKVDPDEEEPLWWGPWVSRVSSMLLVYLLIVQHVF